MDSLDENLNGYCADIKRFTKEKDYKSALMLVSGLRKYIIDVRKKGVN